MITPPGGPVVNDVTGLCQQHAAVCTQTMVFWVETSGAAPEVVVGMLAETLADLRARCRRLCRS